MLRGILLILFFLDAKLGLFCLSTSILPPFHLATRPPQPPTLDSPLSTLCHRPTSLPNPNSSTPKAHPYTHGYQPPSPNNHPQLPSPTTTHPIDPNCPPKQLPATPPQTPTTPISATHSSHCAHKSHPQLTPPSPAKLPAPPLPIRIPTQTLPERHAAAPTRPPPGQKKSATGIHILCNPSCMLPKDLQKALCARLIPIRKTNPGIIHGTFHSISHVRFHAFSINFFHGTFHRLFHRMFRGIFRGKFHGKFHGLFHGLCHESFFGMFHELVAISRKVHGILHGIVLGIFQCIPTSP